MGVQVSAVVLAAGQGIRFGSGEVKVLARLAGRTLLEHALDRLQASGVVDELVVVLPRQEVDRGRVAEEVGLAGAARFVPGGARRQDSAAAGFAATSPGAGIILVHDAARPLASPTLVQRVVAAAREHGAAAPACLAVDSVKEGEDGFVMRSLPRHRIYLTQTPQGFQRELLQRMYDTAREQALEVTDEAQLAETIGLRVALVAGDRSNLKITTREDLAMAAGILTAAGSGGGCEGSSPG
jgi:2-C-methyl-D-erythritol 4-phosphate cytidylyltransferase